MLPYKFVDGNAFTDDGGVYGCEGGCDGYLRYPCGECTLISFGRQEFFRLELERLRSLPADGAKIRMSMLDSKSDLKDLIDDCERFKNEGF